MDYSVGIMPRALLHGVIPLGVRAGGVVPIPVSDRSMMLPSAGASALVGFASGAAMIELGGHVGLGLVAGDLDTTAFRAGVTWHRFEELDGTIWLLEIGFVRALQRSSEH